MIWDIVGGMVIIILCVVIFGAGYLVGKYNNEPPQDR
jgi:hypothetical protein